MSISNHDHLVNGELLAIARSGLGGFRKFAFVPASDPGMGAGGGGGAPPGSGGAPPPDPSMGGGAPPPDPSGGGGGGGGQDPMVAQLMQQMQQMQMQMQQMQQGGGGGAGGAGALKPKVDVNSVLLQILKIQARIADQLGVKIPASEMVVNQQDIGQLASATQSGAPMPGMDPSAGGGGGAAGGGGAISGMPPMDPMQGAGQPGAQKAGSYHGNGTAFDTRGLTDVGSKASSIGMLLKMNRQQR